MDFINRTSIWLIYTVVLLPCVVLAESNPYGESVTVNGSSITINKEFLDEIEKSPTAEKWKANYWELLYFIEIGDRQAISTGIDLLLNVKGHRTNYDDHLGVKNLAVALTMTLEFHSVICEKSESTVVELSEYYKHYRGDYVSDYDSPWLIEWCQ